MQHNAKNDFLKKTMEESYINYAMSVIASRALPDVRDGLNVITSYSIHYTKLYERALILSFWLRFCEQQNVRA